MKYNYAEYVPMLKALADETRLKITDMLSCGEMCACDILEFFNITQPTLSYHMKILADCELVNARKEGAWMKYSLNMPKFEALQKFLREIGTATDDCICKGFGKCSSDLKCK
jgi:ArsR family transcriptional regulator